MGSAGLDYEKKKTEVTGDFDKAGQKSNHAKLGFGICPLSEPLDSNSKCRTIRRAQDKDGSSLVGSVMLF